jgi:hypothetical protein
MHRRPLPPDAEVVVGRVEPMLVNGGRTLKALSTRFFIDVERKWRQHGAKVLDDLAKNHPAQFFAGMVGMSKAVKWDVLEDDGGFSRAMTAEEIMDTLEKRVGPEGRKLFEEFLRSVNALQAKQLAEQKEEEEEEGEEEDEK